jgi:uncharacterized protein (TIGR03435 family)
MRKSWFLCVLVGATLAVVLAQSNAQPGKLEFEVASVRPVGPQAGGPRYVRIAGGPGTADTGRITFSNYALKGLIATAYDVKDYQVTGPSWLDTERYDIVAKIPEATTLEGTTKEQVNRMLQSLLADRFKLTLHHVTKQFTLYELVVGKNGPKMKASQDSTGAADSPTAGPGRGSPIPIGKDGFPILPAGRGMIQMQMIGRRRIAANAQSMADLVDLLGKQLGAPVEDQTGLGAAYDFTLDFATGPGRGLDALVAPVAADSAADAPNFFVAVQEQLGLKLEQKTGALDVLVIDQADKVPTEN